MKKGGSFVLISVLLVFMAGCSYSQKAGTPTSHHLVPDNQQTHQDQQPQVQRE